ncbi:MAG: hypothetical protein GY758_04160 [Fuerstiella sp.]|nr:hypothetical protein [Fuerstiella sp.]MCP4512333.1 hypothetical protein [Fuerstiella sp.]MDG2127891.1 hypothetical protein [Fuerstiella sp.]
MSWRVKGANLNRNTDDIEGQNVDGVTGNDLLCRVVNQRETRRWSYILAVLL